MVFRMHIRYRIKNTHKEIRFNELLLALQKLKGLVGHWLAGENERSIDNQPGELSCEAGTQSNQYQKSKPVLLSVAPLPHNHRVGV